MPPPDDFNPLIGRAETLEPGLRRIVAPNPSPMTYRGTNTYLLGSSEIAVIDPGPRNADHLAAVLDALAPGQKITHIIVTHAHLDHAPLARVLQEACGAPIYAFGPAEKGRSEVMQRLAAAGLTGGGEDVDTDFAPDHALADNAVLDGAGWQLRALHTPGHIGNHICLAWQDACFTADHVMGWASSLVSPPDGDLTDFMASCKRLQAFTWRRFYPGHGDIVDEPQNRLDWLISHRLAREAAILHALSHGPATVQALTDLIYTDTPVALQAAAMRNVLAHLIDLAGKKSVMTDGDLTAQESFRLT